MTRRWATTAVVVLAVLDVVVLALGYRARGGTLPPLQNEEPALAIDTGWRTATPEPDESEEDAVTGPVLLSVNAAGDVLRAHRGACEAQFDDPARVWVGNVDTELLEEADVPGVREVLGLLVDVGGNLHVAGLDQGCDPVNLVSDDVGATWEPETGTTIWQLDADTTASSVTGPGGHEVPVGCPTDQLINLPGRQALASCDSTTFFVLRPKRGPRSLSVPSYEQLSVARSPNAGRYYVLGATDRCDAQVAELNTATSEVSLLACLHDESVGPRAPLAIAAAGESLVVQVGNELMASKDGGGTFENVGPQ